MVIERTDTEILIKLPSTVDTDDLQDLIDYLKYKELTSDINVPQSKIDELANELNENWLNENSEKHGE